MTVAGRIRELWQRWLTFREAEEGRWRAEAGERRSENLPGETGEDAAGCEIAPGAPSLEDLVAARQAEQRHAHQGDSDSGRVDDA